MNQRYPTGDTPETLEGNAAHWVAWELLYGRPVKDGDVAPNGTVVTDEMLDGAAVLIEALRSNPAMAGLQWHVEEPVSIATIHPQCWGTPDLWAYDATHSTLWLPDYKFGHRFVDEFENEQLISYALGVVGQLGVDPAAVTVHGCIIQPRCYYRGKPSRVWSFRLPEVAHIIGELQQSAAEALGPNPRCVTNDACRDCPGRHACPALQLGAYSDAEFSVQSPPVELDPAAASLELRMLERAYDRLGARIEGMKEQVTAYARQGARLPFHRVEQGYGRRQWTIPAGQVVAIGSMYGKDLTKPAVITPTQAKAAGVDEAVINAYSISSPGSIKLIPENPADVRKVFGNK